MEDLIDKRNRKEKIARSVIKRWNVHYITEEELREKLAQEEAQRRQEELKRTNEVLERLRAEAEADEAAKQAEILELLEQQKQEEAGFNAATKSRSGDYGRQKVEDETTLAQINAILGEKEEKFEQQLQHIMDEKKE